MLAFVTVGSTRFDSLVQAILSTPVLTCLRQKGYTRLTVQCGNSSFDQATPASGSAVALQKEDVDIEIWQFKPSLETEFERADLVISHAGAIASGNLISGAFLTSIRRRIRHYPRCATAGQAFDRCPKPDSAGQSSGGTSVFARRS
jgi:UDP-N-acetylglucosamine transferase subunit ALG13